LAQGMAAQECIHAGSKVRTIACARDPSAENMTKIFVPPKAPGDPPALSEDKGKPLFKALGLPRYSFQMPQNVYGMSALVGTITDPQTPLEWFVTCGETYIRCTINYIVQMCLLCAVYQLDLWQMDAIDNGLKNKDDSCYKLTAFFFVFNLWIFCAVVLSEIFETFDMIEIVLRRIPLVEGTTQCLLYKIEDGDPVYQSGGMSMFRKIFICMFVLGPKLAIGISMLIVGGLFLNTSGSNTDLLLNSLAAVFILDLDEIIYTFATPGHLKRLLESVPSFDAEVAPVYEILRATSILWKILLSGLLVIIFYVTPTHCKLDPCTDAIRTCPVVSFL